MEKKNVSVGILTDPSGEFMYEYQAIDIGQLTNNEDIDIALSEDDILKVWRYFIQLNENGNYYYTEEFDIHDEKFIGYSDFLNINNFIGNLNEKNFDDIKNKELFSTEEGEEGSTSSDIDNIINKVDSIIPVSSVSNITNSDDTSLKEIIVKIEKKNQLRCLIY